MDAVTPIGPNSPGIYYDLDEEAYHSGPGISKSGLWTIHTKSPMHYRFGEPYKSKAFDFGKATHFAILQPNEFEKRVFRGPDDRRGNKWKDAEAWCASQRKLLLPSYDYDEALTVRDVVHSDNRIHNLITGGKPRVEMSAYWMRNGFLCKCRPDLYREDIGVIVDLKSTEGADPVSFARSVVNYGYHVQEPWYTDGINSALDAVRSPDVFIPAEGDDGVDSEVKGTAPGGVQGFCFLAAEKSQPYAFKLYELPPSIVEEGRLIAERAFETYAKCLSAGQWPAYGDGVTELHFPRWAYKLTKAPENVDEDA